MNQKEQEKFQRDELFRYLELFIEYKVKEMQNNDVEDAVAFHAVRDDFKQFIESLVEQ